MLSIQLGCGAHVLGPGMHCKSLVWICRSVTRTDNCELVKKLCFSFLEPEGSSPNSQKAYHCTNTEPVLIQFTPVYPVHPRFEKSYFVILVPIFGESQNFEDPNRLQASCINDSSMVMIGPIRHAENCPCHTVRPILSPANLYLKSILELFFRGKKWPMGETNH
jgi:hypothetical protein